MIQWPSEKVTWLLDELKKARVERERVSREYGWQDNLDRYVPKPKRDDRGQPIWEVNVGADFRDVERKKAALFYDTPEITLLPTQERDLGQAGNGQPVKLSQLVFWHAELLNGMLGPRHANVKPTVLKAIFDCLCPAGFGPVKIGYETRTVPVDAPQRDPQTGQPITDAFGQPVTQSVEVPIFERWFISRVSPKAHLLPAEFRDTDYDAASWQGYDWQKPASQVRRDYGLPEDWQPKGGNDTHKPYFSEDDQPSGSDHDPLVTGTYVEYRLEDFAEPGAAVHPQAIGVIVFVDEKIVKHEPLECQTIGDDGRMTLDSVTSFTIKPLVLRDLSDHKYVPSDCTVTGALTKELNKFRTQTVKQRDAQRHLVLYDTEKISPDLKDKLERGDIGQFAGVEGGALAAGVDAIMKQVTTVQQGRESYLGQDYIERDREKILGIGDNQSGGQTQSKRTATETAVIQRNSEARFEQERQRVLEWYLALVRQFDMFLLRYADARTATLILGPDRGPLWAQFKQALLGGYTYELQIDSGKYLDVNTEIQKWTGLYNLTAQDPNVRRTVTLRELGKRFGLDPNEWVVEQLPEKGPDAPKVSVTIAGDQLNPVLPQFPILIELLRQGGYKISAESIQAAQQQAQQVAQLLSGQGVPVAGAGPDPNAQPPGGQPEHGGGQPGADLVNKHQMDQTGQRPGPQAPAQVM